jgi:hypothetical protein
MKNDNLSKNEKYGKKSKTTFTGQICYGVAHIQQIKFQQKILNIGVFSTKLKAKKAIAELKLKPGFLTKGRFSTYKVIIDFVGWQDGFVDPYE